ANPASGKDIRRLISGASVFDNQEKRNIVRRAVLGAIAAGERCFRHVPDAHGIAASALADAAPGADVAPVPLELTDSALDTSRGAAKMCEEGCGAVLVLGGDGTNRAAALGWSDLPVVAVSTGTNNVFPRMVEGTLAGLAGGLVSTGKVRLEDASTQVKTIRIGIEGEPDDLALIDAALRARSSVHGQCGTRIRCGSSSSRAPNRPRWVCHRSRL
ncbi:MAG: NAD(+)/NADH kinase, partial [Dehalococcoidia bacterium]